MTLSISSIHSWKTGFYASNYFHTNTSYPFALNSSAPMNLKVIVADTPALVTFNMWVITPKIPVFCSFFHRTVNEGVKQLSQRQEPFWILLFSFGLINIRIRLLPNSLGHFLPVLQVALLYTWVFRNLENTYLLLSFYVYLVSHKQFRVRGRLLRLNYNEIHRDFFLLNRLQMYRRCTYCVSITKRSTSFFEFTIF